MASVAPGFPGAVVRHDRSGQDVGSRARSEVEGAVIVHPLPGHVVRPQKPHHVSPGVRWVHDDLDAAALSGEALGAVARGTDCEPERPPPVRIGGCLNHYDSVGRIGAAIHRRLMQERAPCEVQTVGRRTEIDLLEVIMQQVRATFRLVNQQLDLAVGGGSEGSPCLEMDP